MGHIRKREAAVGGARRARASGWSATACRRRSPQQIWRGSRELRATTAFPNRTRGASRSSPTRRRGSRRTTRRNSSRHPQRVADGILSAVDADPRCAPQGSRCGRPACRDGAAASAPSSTPTIPSARHCASDGGTFAASATNRSSGSRRRGRPDRSTPSTTSSVARRSLRADALHLARSGRLRRLGTRSPPRRVGGAARRAATSCHWRRAAHPARAARAARETSSSFSTITPPASSVQRPPDGARARPPARGRRARQPRSAEARGRRDMLVGGLVTDPPAAADARMARSSSCSRTSTASST